MAWSPALQTILDEALAEAKRGGHARAELVHVAQALRRRDREAFAQRFDVDVLPALERMLAAAARSSRPPEVGDDARALLDDAQRAGGSTTVVLDLLRDRLGPLTTSGDGAGVPGGSTVDGGTDSDVSAALDGSASPKAVIPDHIASLVEVVEGRTDVLGRDDLLDEVLSLLARRVPVSPCLVARPGSGRTAVLAALAGRLVAGESVGALGGYTLVRVNPEAVLRNGRASALKRVLDNLDDDVVVALDDVEVLTGMGGQGVDVMMLGLIRGALEDPERRVVLTVADPYDTRLAVHDAELAEELHVVRVPVLDDVTLRAVVGGRVEQLSQFHGVRYDDVLDAALTPPARGTERAHPGLGIERLDGAGARASLRVDKVVRADDLRLGGEAPAGALNASDLERRLRARIRGQDAAIATIASRLALTRAQLDLRPERPDGVFLLVGPTGVGKTALARALCSELFGDEERLVRLDMSEYAHDWAVSRLIGPQPGFVGYTEPEGWLTTKVREQPNTVVLLDEIEKAHPTVWNTFLQVFDVGRLTDARGNVADFSHCVVAMTSNLGASAFKGAAVGFATGSGDATEDARVRDAVTSAMAPELINRLDAIVVFHPLTREAIAEIAKDEIERALARLGSRGYALSVDSAVGELVAEEGYDPAYGARHLQRNIERLVLQPLVGLAAGAWRAGVDGGRVVWRDQSGAPSGAPQA